MIIEAAIGDAYGAGFEFADMEFIREKNKLTQYERHPLFDTIYKKYTDNTQMALAIAELLIEKKEWTPLTVAEKFVEVFKRDPRHGYARGFYQLLSEVASGQELMDRIAPASIRNGAVMRVYPLGILPDEQEILQKAEMQSKITHNTENAIVSSQAMALAAHFFVYEKGDSSALTEYLYDLQKVRWRLDWQGEVSIDAIQTVHAVFTVLSEAHSFSEILKKSVDLGGDVDTVASLALALAAVDKNMENDLPRWLYDELENEQFGRDYILNIDNELFKLKDAMSIA